MKNFSLHHFTPLLCIKSEKVKKDIGKCLTFKLIYNLQSKINTIQQCKTIFIGFNNIHPPSLKTHPPKQC